VSNLTIKSVINSANLCSHIKSIYSAITFFYFLAYV